MRNKNMQDHMDKVVALAQRACAAYCLSPVNADMQALFDEVEERIAQTEALFGREMDVAGFALSLSEHMTIRGEGAALNAFKSCARTSGTQLFREYSNFMARLADYHEVRFAWLKDRKQDEEALAVARRALRTTVAVSGARPLHAGHGVNKAGGA